MYSKVYQFDTLRQNTIFCLIWIRIWILLYVYFLLEESAVCLLLHKKSAVCILLRKISCLFTFEKNQLIVNLWKNQLFVYFCQKISCLFTFFIVRSAVCLLDKEKFSQFLFTFLQGKSAVYLPFKKQKSKVSSKVSDFQTYLSFSPSVFSRDTHNTAV